MSESKDARDRHGHQLRSMGPPGDDKDDVWSTDVESAAGLPRISLAGGLPRTPVGGSAVDRIRDQPADLEHHRSPRVLDFKAIVEAQDRLLVPEQTAPQKLNTERDTAAESAMNAALAQAAQTYRASQEVGVSQALREEIKLLNDVHRPAESKLQPLQESTSRQVSMVPTPSCPEGGANGPAEIQQRQDTGGCYRRPPELPPRQRPRTRVSSDRQERSPRTAMAHRGRRIFGTSRGYTPTREPATETATSEWTAGTSHSAERSSCSGSTSVRGTKFCETSTYSYPAERRSGIGYTYANPEWTLGPSCAGLRWIGSVVTTKGCLSYFSVTNSRERARMTTSIPCNKSPHA